jgi:hypothetical protein
MDNYSKAFLAPPPKRNLQLSSTNFAEDFNDNWQLFAKAHHCRTEMKI